MNIKCTGIILTGGESKRLSGRNKAFLEIGGKRIIDSLYDIFTEIFDEIILVTNSPQDYLDKDLKIVTDIYSKRCALTGLHTGLFYASHPYAFFTACDTPFLKKEMVALVTSRIRPNKDVIIPETNEGIEPLCAAYSKRCLKQAAKNLDAGIFQIRRFFDERKVLKIPEPELLKIDPQLVSFFNVNTPEDLELAGRMS